MDLIAVEETPKLALGHFARHTPDMTIMQWFHFDDPMMDSAVDRPRLAGVVHPRAGACASADEGLQPHPISSPKDPMDFANFRARPIDRNTAVPVGALAR
jgi:hypothetical protein